MPTYFTFKFANIFRQFTFYSISFNLHISYQLFHHIGAHQPYLCVCLHWHIICQNFGISIILFLSSKHMAVMYVRWLQNQHCYRNSAYINHTGQCLRAFSTTTVPYTEVLHVCNTLLFCIHMQNCLISIMTELVSFQQWDLWKLVF